MNDQKIAHLEMIQSVISRMSSTSALFKGWTVALLAAVFALAAKDSNPRFILVAFIPTIMFWSLDAYYLGQERLFRKLYDDVRKTENDLIDFDMSTEPYGRQIGYPFFAMVNLLFYGFLILLFAAVFYYQ